MSVGGIEDCCIRAALCELLDETNLGMVHIQSQHGTACHGLDFSSVVTKLAAYEAALVLGSLLVGFLHLRILFHRICGTDGGLQFFTQGIPCDGLVRPQLCLTTVAVGDR